MIFAVFTAKTAVFNRRMKLDGVLHLAFMHLQHPLFHVFLFFKLQINESHCFFFLFML